MEVKVTGRKYSWATALHGSKPKSVYSQWCVSNLECKGAELVTSQTCWSPASDRAFVCSLTTLLLIHNFSWYLLIHFFPKELMLIHAFLHLKRIVLSIQCCSVQSIGHPMTSSNEKIHMGKQLISSMSHEKSANFSDASQRWKKKNASTVNYSVSIHYTDCDNNYSFHYFFHILNSSPSKFCTTGS